VSPEKGVHDLIEAFTIVAESFPKVRLDIAGPIVAFPKEFIVGVSDDPAGPISPPSMRALMALISVS